MCPSGLERATYSVARLPIAPTLFSTMIDRPIQRAHFVGEVAHDDVGAAAGRKRADEVYVLCGVGLGLGGLRSGRGDREQGDRSNQISVDRMRALRLLRLFRQSSAG